MTQIFKTSSRTFKIAGGVAVVALVAAVAYYLHTHANEKRALPTVKENIEPGVIQFAPDAPQLSSLKIAVVNAVPLPVSDPVNGRIAYDENVTSRVSSPIPGRVIRLHAELGDVVQQGAALVEIDSPDLATAEADLSKAQADEHLKKLAFERARTLFEGEVLARKDYESAEADYQQAAAETRRAGLRIKNLNAVGEQDGKFSLKSPIAGVVADKQINPGLEVRPDLPNPLFVISNLSRLWVIADVPERSAAALHVGQDVSIETDAEPGQPFAAKIERIGLVLDPLTRRIQVRCAVKNVDHKLKPEMFARVAFLADDRSKMAIPVPNSSLFVTGMYSYVFVEKHPGTFEQRRVNVSINGHERSFVDAGLTSGERIVTEGAFLLNAEVSSHAE